MSQNENKLSAFPAFFKVKDRYILIIGSGSAALSRIRLIAETSAFIISVAPNPEAQLYAYLKGMELSCTAIKWLDTQFDSTMLNGAVLVFAATGDIAQDRVIVNAANQAHIPVNVIDRPELCDFFTPAIVNRAPVVVAVGSEGTGPVLTQLIRSRIDALLCPAVGRLARFAASLRGRVDASLTKGTARRRFWHSVFTGSVARAIINNDDAVAEKCVLELLDSISDVNCRVRFLDVGHGVIDWLTLGGQRALMESDVIIYDVDVINSILAMVRRDADLLSVPKKSPFSIQLIKRFYEKNRQVLRLVTDQTRLIEETTSLGTCGIEFEIIPFSCNDGFNHTVKKQDDIGTA